MRKSDYNIKMMTEEERQNPSLLKQRKEVQENPISVYYGSAKKELEDVCHTCKSKSNCPLYRDAKKQQELLRKAVQNDSLKQVIKDFSKEEIEKIKNNVFIIVNCIYKENE